MDVDGGSKLRFNISQKLKRLVAPRRALAPESMLDITEKIEAYSRAVEDWLTKKHACASRGCSCAPCLQETQRLRRTTLQMREDALRWQAMANDASLRPEMTVAIEMQSTEYLKETQIRLESLKDLRTALRYCVAPGVRTSFRYA